MRTLIFSLILSLTLPAAFAENQPAGALQCKADEKDTKDPYARMKKLNEDKITLTIQRMGRPPQLYPRQEMMKGLNEHLGQLCTLKKSTEIAATNISTKQAEAKIAEAGPQGCAAYNALSAQNKVFNDYNEGYQQMLREALTEQRTRYNRYFSEEYKLLALEFGKAAMRPSFIDTWGRSEGEAFTEAGRKRGIISNLMWQIEEESRQNASRQEGYKNFGTTLEELKSKCPSLVAGIGDENLKAGAQRPTVPGDKNGDGVVDEKDQFPEAPPPPGGDPAPDPGPTPAPVPEKTSGVGEWASRNKGVLVLGAGAAAVGGLLWYKNKKDKDNKNDIENEADDRLSSTSTSTSTITSTTTSTSTNTSSTTSTSTASITAANGYSLGASGFPASAVVGTAIGSIVVTINGPTGQIPGSGPAITLSCTGSCPISGTLTRTPVAGRVEFTGITFTSHASGVQLRLSAPGLDSVASPGSFNVLNAGSGRE